MNIGFLKKISWKKKSFQEKKEISRESIVKDWTFLLSLFFILFVILTAGYYSLFIFYKKPPLKNMSLENSSLEDTAKKYKEALLRIETWEEDHQKIEINITAENFSL